MSVPTPRIELESFQQLPPLLLGDPSSEGPDKSPDSEPTSNQDGIHDKEDPISLSTSKPADELSPESSVAGAVNNPTFSAAPNQSVPQSDHSTSAASVIMASTPHRSTPAVQGTTQPTFNPPTGAFNFTVPGAPSYPKLVEQTAEALSSSRSSSSQDSIGLLADELFRLFSLPDASPVAREGNANTSTNTGRPTDTGPGFSKFCFASAGAYPVSQGIDLSTRRNGISSFNFTAPGYPEGFSFRPPPPPHAFRFVEPSVPQLLPKFCFSAPGSYPVPSGVPVRDGSQPWVFSFAAHPELPQAQVATSKSGGDSSGDGDEVATFPGASCLP